MSNTKKLQPVFEAGAYDKDICAVCGFHRSSHRTFGSCPPGEVVGTPKPDRMGNLAERLAGYLDAANQIPRLFPGDEQVSLKNRLRDLGRDKFREELARGRAERERLENRDNPDRNSLDEKIREFARVLRVSVEEVQTLYQRLGPITFDEWFERREKIARQLRARADSEILAATRAREAAARQADYRALLQGAQRAMAASKAERPKPAKPLACGPRRYFEED